MRRYTITPVTAADGSATFYSPLLSGKIYAIHYVKNGSTPYAAGVDFTITAQLTGENIWTESNVDASVTVRPRAATHTTAGVAALYAGGGSAVLDYIPLASDKVKIVIANGGDTKTGKFYIMVE
jgi:hypothetical protein